MPALPDPKRPDRANSPTNFDDPFFLLHWYDIHALGSHWADSQQGILCQGFKGVQEEIPLEEACILQIGSDAFRYETIEEMKEAVTKVTDTLTQEDIHRAFQKLLERYKCIAARGDYFEGD